MRRASLRRLRAALRRLLCSKRGKYRASYDYSKLTEAMEEVKEGRMSERQAAKEFNVPRSTLKDRLAEWIKDEKAGRPRGPLS